MWSSVVRIILKGRILVLLLLFALTFVMLSQAKKAKVTDAIVGLLPHDDAEFLQYEKFKSLFGNDANLIVVGVCDSALYDSSNFLNWLKLSDELAQTEGIESAFSIQHTFNLVRNDENENFETKFLFNKDSVSTEDISAFISKLKKLPFYEGLVFNSKTNAVSLIVEMEQSVLENKKRYTLIRSIEKQVSSFEKKTGINLHLSGFPYIRAVNAELLKKEVNLFILLAIFVTAIISLLFFKSARATIVSMFIVSVGVLFSLGIMVFLNYEITVLTALIPPLIIVIGIPNCVFLINKYHHEYRSHGNKIKALSLVIKKTGNAILFTNTTTAAGFATFIVTRTPMLVEFGVLASLSVMSIFFLSITIVPIAYSFLAPPKKRHMRQLHKKWIINSISIMTKLVLYKRKFVFLTTILLLFVAAIGISLVKTTGNFADDIPKGSVLLNDLFFFEQQFKGIMPFDVLIDTKKPNGAIKISCLKKIDKLHDEINKHPEFSRAFSITDLIKFFKQGFYNNSQDFYSIPNSQEKDWILSYVDKSNFNPSLFISLTDSSNRYARVSANVADIGISQMERLKDSLQTKVQKIFNPSLYDVTFTGFSVVFLKSTKYLVRNLFVSLFIAIIFIAIFMAILFDSSRMVLVSLIPNLIPLIITAALMGFLNIAIKPSTLLVFSIAFGISIDDTIHFLAKYRQELQSRKGDVRQSVIASLQETGISMIFTSIILFFGFGVFIASQFGGTQALGMLVSITLLVAMLCNLILLPSLLLAFEKSIHADFFDSYFEEEGKEGEDDLDIKRLIIKPKKNET